MAGGLVSLNWLLLQAVDPPIKNFICTHSVLLQCNVLISECNWIWLCNHKQNLPSMMVYFSQNKYVVHIRAGTGQGRNDSWCTWVSQRMGSQNFKTTKMALLSQCDSKLKICLHIWKDFWHVLHWRKKKITHLF